jgi:hypothetical protein
MEARLEVWDFEPTSLPPGRGEVLKVKLLSNRPNV